MYTKKRAMFFDVQQQFLDLARQIKEAKMRMYTFHYDGEMKGWDWDKYVANQKEQQITMESLGDHGYNGIVAIKSVTFSKEVEALSWR